MSDSIKNEMLRLHILRNENKIKINQIKDNKYNTITNDFYKIKNNINQLGEININISSNNNKKLTSPSYFNTNIKSKSNILNIINTQDIKEKQPFKKSSLININRSSFIYKIENPIVDYGNMTMLEKANIMRNNKKIEKTKLKIKELNTKRQIYDYYNPIQISSIKDIYNNKLRSSLKSTSGKRKEVPFLKVEKSNLEMVNKIKKKLEKEKNKNKNLNFHLGNHLLITKSYYSSVNSYKTNKYYTNKDSILLLNDNNYNYNDYGYRNRSINYHMNNNLYDT